MSLLLSIYVIFLKNIFELCFKQKPAEMSFCFHKMKSSVLYENRYCSQDEFSIVVCGGKDKNWDATKEVSEIRGPDFEKSSELTPMLNPRDEFINTAVVGSDLHVIGGEWTDEWTSFEIYSAKTKGWKECKPPHILLKFCNICSFMKSVYTIGGFEGLAYGKSCYKYNKSLNSWSKMAELNTERHSSACAVFEGKIVVIGGRNGMV